MFHPQGPTFFELAKQALSSTEHGYDLLAPKFDYTPFRTPQILLDAVAPHVGSAGSCGSGLDLCCGTGAGMRLLRPLCRDRVVGLDFSQGMLAVCQERTADAPGPARLEYVRGNALALPFAAEFDIVVCFGACGHIRRRNEVRFVREVARVMRPAGRLVFLTSFLPPVWSSRYWLARLFNGAMHLRNFLVTPPFIMFYLTFLLPEVAILLQRHGFQVEVRELGFSGLWADVRLVLATRTATAG